MTEPHLFAGQHTANGIAACGACGELERDNVHNPLNVISPGALYEMLQQSQEHLVDCWLLIDRLVNHVRVAPSQCPWCAGETRHAFDCPGAEAALAVEALEPMLAPLAALREQETNAGTTTTDTGGETGTAGEPGTNADGRFDTASDDYRAAN